MEEVSPSEGLRRLQSGARLIDVREKDEYQDIHAAGAELLPLSEFMERYTELPKDCDLVFICRSGARSAGVTRHLLQHGYTRVANLAGGLLDWEAENLPVVRNP